MSQVIKYKNFKRQKFLKLQKGSALLYVLLLVVIISSVTVLAISNQKNYRSQLLSQLNDGYWQAEYVQSFVENWYKDVFNSKDDSKDDGKDGSKIAGLLSKFIISGKLDTSFDIDGRKVTVKLRDITNCLNVNAFEPQYNVNGDALEVKIDKIIKLKIYLKLLGVKEERVENMVFSLMDWIDHNKTSYRFGAESFFYQDNKLVPANKRIYDVSELRLIKGFRELAKNILPARLCARSTNKLFSFNVNIIDSNDIPLLIALSNGELSYHNAEQIVAQIKTLEKPIKVKDFLLLLNKYVLTKVTATKFNVNFSDKPKVISLSITTENTIYSRNINYQYIINRSNMFLISKGKFNIPK